MRGQRGVGPYGGKSMKIDVTGERYGKLIAIKRVGTDSYKHPIWLFKCDCGNEHTTLLTNVSRGLTKSCGCIRTAKGRGVVHGYSKSRLYQIYSGIKQRCTNPHIHRFYNYGGRGINICDEWNNNSSSFFKWAVESGYRDDLTIDRKDNNKGYFPDNCQWIPMAEQARNKRCNVFITIDGETNTQAHWAKHFGIYPSSISKLRQRGYSPEEAVHIAVARVSNKTS